MEERQCNHEELEAGRRRALAALLAGAERAQGPPRSDTDQVAIQFDWEVPPQARAPIIFRVRISREDRDSSIRFAIDLNQLQTDDLQTLHDLLAYPSKGYWMVRSIAWLLDTSLRQQQPEWSTEQRNRKVRELLLFSPEP
jgi:hypothetical protein